GRMPLAHGQGERDMLREARIHAGQALPVAPQQFAAERPTRISAQLSAQDPQVPWMVGLEALDAALLQLLADRLEKAPAMLLHQRLEERHAEHFAFTLVDERREILVYVVAEEMAMEKRPAAVRLHEQLDGGLFLRLAAEDLGDDTLQLAAITL